MSSSRTIKLQSPVSPSNQSPKHHLTYEQEEQSKLSEVQVQELLKSEDLISFISSKSSILERALGEALIFDPTHEFITGSASQTTASNSIKASVGEVSESNASASDKSSFDNKALKSLIKVTTVLDGTLHYGNEQKDIYFNICF